MYKKLIKMMILEDVRDVAMYCSDIESHTALAYEYIEDGMFTRLERDDSMDGSIRFDYSVNIGEVIVTYGGYVWTNGARTCYISITDTHEMPITHITVDRKGRGAKSIHRSENYWL